MSKHSTGFVGLDVHKESIAIGMAAEGRTAGRFVGMVGPARPELLKSLKSLGAPEALSIVYEAGPCGYGLVRELDKFEDIRYPETLGVLGAQPTIGLVEQTTPTTGGPLPPERTFELTLPPVERLLALVFAKTNISRLPMTHL